MVQGKSLSFNCIQVVYRDLPWAFVLQLRVMEEEARKGLCQAVGSN